MSSEIKSYKDLIIKQIVRQEIDKIVAENDGTIKEIVKATLLPELRNAVRGAILEALEDLVKESPDLGDTQKIVEDAVPNNNKENRKSETDLNASLEPETWDFAHQTANLESRTSNLEPMSGRYLYCVVEASEKMNFGKIGIEENEVYTIPYEDISAVVHNCPAEPYKSEDEEIMKNWVMAHQCVIDRVWERFGTVLPLGFDTIIQGNETTSPEENMKNWLKQDYDNLKRKIEKISGKAEYGVQVFWDPKIIAKNVTEESREIKKLNEELKSKPKGLAYMYKQKLENLIKKEMERKADQDFKEFFERIKSCVDDIRVEKTKKAEDERQMLMNLSCLLPSDRSKGLGDELEKIETLEGFSVRYTGPWPPYSFV